MAYVNPSTFIAGNVLTAAQQNVLAANDRFFHGVPTVRVHGTTNTTAAQSVVVYVKFGTEAWDSDSMWSSTANTVFNINTAGKYLVGGAVQWQASTDGSFRDLSIVDNLGVVHAEVMEQPPEPGTIGPRQSITTMLSLTSTQSVRLGIEHDVAAGLLITDSTARKSPSFWAVWQSS